MIEQELQELISGCKKQDRQSQKLLYQKLYGFAMKICLRYANNYQEATEVLNDGFFKALTNIEKYDENRPFTTWLSKIIYHASIDYYRANLKWTRIEKLEQSDDLPNEATAERKLRYEDLLAMVQRLPPTYRMVFNLYAIDGYSHDEIAELIGISASTSRSNLYKARQKLQQMLAHPQSIVVFLLWKSTIASTIQFLNHPGFHSKSHEL
ncbi:RNA polymerase sigma factor [Sunxiuqinia rutila]|uniref:RNA polymerase sigma factor n=1 Tax=Sunxiuqinia rutila TaxID=1397841 RepID=UPI003D3675DA